MLATLNLSTCSSLHELEKLLKKVEVDGKNFLVGDEERSKDELIHKYFSLVKASKFDADDIKTAARIVHRLKELMHEHDSLHKHAPHVNHKDLALQTLEIFKDSSHAKHMWREMFGLKNASELTSKKLKSKESPLHQFATALDQIIPLVNEVEGKHKIELEREIFLAKAQLKKL